MLLLSNVSYGHLKRGQKMHEIKNQISLQSGLLSEYLKPQEIEMLQTYSQFVFFNNGDIILQQGKKSDGIYVILNGSVIATAKMLGEGTTNLETLGPCNFLGEISFIEKVPCATSIVAVSKVECLYITETFFELLTTYFPETKYKLLTAICKQVSSRLKKMHDKIILFISSSNMSERSFFSEVIQSLTKPTEVPLTEANYPALLSFKKEEIDELLKHTILLKASKNCTLIHKSDKNPLCYIVVQGAVQSTIMHDNKVAKLSVIGPATLFANIACVDKNSPFTITFTTCEQAVLLKLTESDLIFFQKERPSLWYKIFDLICLSIIALEKSVDKLDIRLNIETYNR
jgi:CRP-like cAMP-binding protein